MNLNLNPEVSRGTKKGRSAYSLRLKAKNVQCQVQGCIEELPTGTAYHRRYKICAYHATLPQMVVDGRHLRFCQQCGRFQPLSDFDSDRKSCRKTLQRHNRRRKMIRDTLSLSNRVASGGGDNDSSPLSGSDKRHSSDPTTDEDGYYGVLAPGAAATTSATADKISEGATNPSDATRPLSVSDVLGSDALEFDHDFDIDELLNHFDSEARTTTAPAAAASDPVGAGEMALRLDSIITAPILPLIHINESSISIETKKDLTNAAAAAVAAPQPPPTTNILSLPPNPPVQMQIAEGLLMSNNAAGGGGRSGSGSGSGVETRGESAPPSDLVRVSFKLFNVHPSELPPTMLQELENMMNSSAFVYINARIGCTHLTADALLSLEDIALLKSQGSKHLLESALSRGPSFFPEKTFEGPRGHVLAQIGDQASIVGGSFDVAVTISSISKSTASPVLKNLVPFAAVPGEKCSFGMYGSNITAGQCMVICRRGCALSNLEVSRAGFTERNEEYVEFVLPRPVLGLHFVEVQRRSLLSPTSLPFLVIDSLAAVQELRQLEYDTRGVGAEQESVTSFLRSVGVVLDWLRKKEETTITSNGPIPGYTSYISDPLQNKPETAEIIAPLAQRIAAICVLRGWPALLQLILPAIVPPGADPAAVIEEFKSFSNDGLPLVHLAVLSRSPEVVNVLAEWSQLPTINYSWRCEGAAFFLLVLRWLSYLLILSVFSFK